MCSDQAYYVSIIMYLATLYQVWCSYHNYVKKIIKVKIFWHHSGPFGLLLSHSSYFFKGIRPSFNGSMCCLCFFKMLGFDHFCISFLFLARWSPYSFKCNGTCKYRYLSFLGRTLWYPCNVTWGCPITCFVFREFSSVILSSNAVFFNGPTTWVWIYFAFL
jgi:hypothetical protein